jgi:hypothetical protein
MHIYLFYRIWLANASAASAAAVAEKINKNKAKHLSYLLSSFC